MTFVFSFLPWLVGRHGKHCSCVLWVVNARAIKHRCSGYWGVRTTLDTHIYSRISARRALTRKPNTQLQPNSYFIGSTIANFIKTTLKKLTTG